VTLADRFPKWNPRYVAFALAHGATDIKAFRDAQESNAAFIAWIAERRETWRLEQRIRSPHLTRKQERAFDAWLERQYADPTYVRTIVAEVMDEVRGFSPAEAAST
jgi:hypothetical protein